MSQRRLSTWSAVVVVALACAGNAVAAVFTAPFGPGGTWNLYEPIFITQQQRTAMQLSQVPDAFGLGLIGHMATIHSLSENNMVHRIAGFGDVWIGLTDRFGIPGASEAGSSTTTGWAWITGEPFSFQNWAGGEPNDFNGIEDAAHIRSDGLWNDHSSGWPINQPAAHPTNADETGGPFMKYVIEWEANSPVPVPGATIPQLGLMPVAGTLPGPAVLPNLWAVREVYDNGFIDNLQNAIDSINAGTGRIVDGYVRQVNHSDPESRGGQGLFVPDSDFLGQTPGVDNEDFAVLYRSKLTIPTPGDWTVSVRSDDGFGLRIVGANFTAVNGPGQIDGTDTSVVAHPGNTGDSNTRALANLAAGTYDVELIYWERGGGAFVEFGLGQGNLLAGGAFAAPFPRDSFFLSPDAPPGPMGGNMFAGLREVKMNGPIADIDQAMAILYGGAGVITDGIAPVINHSDPETNGTASAGFGGDLPFLNNTPGDDQYIVASFMGRIRIEEAGDYTFQVRSDDGFALRIRGEDFHAVSGVGALAADGSVGFAGLTCCSDTFATINLAAGDYDLEFVSWENEGGAYWEVSAAKGANPSPDQYRVLGHKAGDPTYKPGIDGNNWSVVFSPVGGNLINNFNDLRNDIAAGPNTVVFGVDNINYTDSATNGAGPGSFGGDKEIPNGTPGDDNDYGMIAEATLVIPVTGFYEFGFRGDDGGYIWIPGRAWDSIIVNATGATILANIFGTGVNDTLWCDCLTGDSNSVGRIFLDAGVYGIEVGFFERGGGSWFEVFARGNGAMGLLGGPPMIMPDVDGIQFVDKVIPLPAAAWMGLSLMGAMGLTRRRRRTA